jgi:pyruvate kinase
MNLNEIRRTKIISTVGPACDSEEILTSLITAGVNVFRLNFSHGTHEAHLNNINKIRKVSKLLSKEVGIILDLQGPKIRIGKIIEGGINLIDGTEFIISTDEYLGQGSKASTTYKNLPHDVKENDRILIDDGLIELRVKSVVGNDVFTEVKNGGLLTSNKGINLPYVKVSSKAVTDKDREDVLFAVNNDVDFIALSFVRAPEDVIELKNLLKSYNRKIPIISKIEKPEALECIDQIIKESHAIMVARGDLGVELSTEDVPIVQKDLIARCNKIGKPVIVATQMLDSMIRNPRPTRAEASDVANAVLDGCDAVMLSGETASGKFPLEAVKMMNKIIFSTETKFINVNYRRRHNESYDIKNISDAIALSAVNIARTLNAKIIASITHSGNTAQQLSRFKSHLPILAITDEPKVMCKLSIVWGVTPILINKIEKTDECFTIIEDLIENFGSLNNGDLIIFTAGMPTLEKNSTNMIKVHTVEKGNTHIF